MASKVLFRKLVAKMMLKGISICKKSSSNIIKTQQWQIQARTHINRHSVITRCRRNQEMPQQCK